MPWTELSQRPEHLRALVLITLQTKKKTPQFYFQEKLGLLSDADLESYLNSLNIAEDAAKTASEKELDSTSTPPMANDMSSNSSLESSLRSDQNMNRSPQERILPEDVRQVRSIGWIRKNGLTDEDRLRAEEMYRELVMDLWYKHVAETGQTYYPPLQNELLDEYTLQANQ
jgi:hypothetical protein